VIISHAELHESVAPLAVIGPVMVQAARNAKVPVCVHLDHCETLSYMAEALKLGFTGVMYDGSVLPYEENAANTRTAVAMAKEYGANVEAEIGQLASREGGLDANSGGPVYTDPDLAVKFCGETGIDALAPSFGTAHGIYKSTPVLDLERVKVIAEKTKLPLVMHGGSGVSDEDYRTAIRNGIRKINYYSYMSKAGVTAVKELLDTGDVTFFHDVALAAQNAMEENAYRAMKIFAFR
jgi:fructose-bisphosphate aldolase class II